MGLELLVWHCHDHGVEIRVLVLVWRRVDLEIKVKIKGQYSKPRLRRYHYLPPGSLHALGACESLSCSHVSLNWCNIACVGYISHRLTWIKFIIMFPMFEQILYRQIFSLKNYCCINTTSHCSDVCGYNRCPQTLAEICRNMGICCGLRAVAAREKYPRFILFSKNHFTILVNCTRIVRNSELDTYNRFVKHVPIFRNIVMHLFYESIQNTDEATYEKIYE